MKNIIINQHYFGKDLSLLNVGDVIATLHLSEKKRISIEVNGEEKETYLEMVDYEKIDEIFVDVGFSEPFYEIPKTMNEIEELFENWLSQENPYYGLFDLKSSDFKKDERFLSKSYADVLHAGAEFVRMLIENDPEGILEDGESLEDFLKHTSEEELLQLWNYEVRQMDEFTYYKNGGVV